METAVLTNLQARRFILYKQGLLGEPRFFGKEGVTAFIREAGCIQYDPIDVCGKNAELVLQSRVKGFTKTMLGDLLYRDRILVDYFDKNLAIIPVGEWPNFERYRQHNRQRGRSRTEIDAVAEQIKTLIRQKGPLCSADIDMGQTVNWYWNDTRLSRAALETLYFRGDLIIHHKKGTNKYYALSEDFIPDAILHAPDPAGKDADYLKWHILRRIAAVGLLWNRPSDAWLNIMGLNAAKRAAAFDALQAEGKIMPIIVEESRQTFYMLTEDLPLLKQVCTDKHLKPRTELIAPLDNMLWDRKLIQELFGFQYKWEIYTPVSERKFGYYVLPILSGDRFIGRAEITRDLKSKTLHVKNIWLEPGVKTGKGLTEKLNHCLSRFALFNGCDKLELKLEYPFG